MRGLMRGGAIRALLIWPALILGASARAQIVNGGFEIGDFSGWDRSGYFSLTGSPTTGGPNYATFAAAVASASPVADANAVVTSQTSAYDGLGPISSPPIAPKRGQYLAFVSTANIDPNGVNTMDGSAISQSFVVPDSASQIVFDARFLSDADLTDPFFADFNDFGGVALTQGGTVLAQYNFDLAGLADSSVSGVAAGGFQDSADWQHIAFDVSGLVGQTVTLTAYATNYGGTEEVESRILLDNVTITPEPGIGVVAATMLCCLIFPCALRGQARSSVCKNDVLPK